MEIEETDNKDVSDCVEPNTAVNNLILDYYKKFGKKRDLEQFFSLSTAQSEIRDPSSLFWRRMKSQDESSDSVGKKSESSTELCRISIKCSIPERPSSQGNHSRVKSDSESPPIISEEVITEPTRNSDDESVKSDDLQSQKSVDETLDTSTNKPHSPTSSINSQRKLEWDSLADVGYANESDRKNSASSLSTLERMALQQQYSNDTKNSDLGQPTAQSTPFDVNENKSKFKRSVIKKTTKIYNKDINSLELSVPPIFDANPQAINLNLTKHISFNVDRNGSVFVENMSKNVSLSPQKVSVETEVTPQIKLDKEIQTSLNRDKSGSSNEKLMSAPQVKRYPVLINLNTLKKKTRKKKVRRTQKFQSKKKKMSDKENLPLEKCGDQLSKAESFEYMPGHIYNENRMKNIQQKNNVTGNKSSLESSGITTDSSNKNFSFTKDLERSIDILKSKFDGKYEDDTLRKQLVKEIVQKIVDSKYCGEKSSTEFLSGLSLDSKKLELRDPSYSTTTTSTSTSDLNTSAKKVIISKPKKSILRMDKFNTTSALASTSQSVPNIPIFTNNETCDSPNILKSKDISNTDSDYSIKTKNLSDTAVNKTSSEELYKKYLEALKREQAHKKHLKDKEIFLKQKLSHSECNFNVVKQVDSETQNRIKNLMKDLVRNNYDDGSGDASKLEGGSSANLNIDRYNSIRKQQSHSVFTLSSGNSENNFNNKIAYKHQNEPGGSRINKSAKHYCCCPYHSSHLKVGVTDSSVQVSMECPKNLITSDCKINSSHHQHPKESEMEPLRSESVRKKEIISECTADNIKYVCLCTEEGVVTEEIPENFLIYKCSRLPTKCIKLGGIVSKVTNTPSVCSSKSSFKSHDCENKCLVIKDSNSSNNLTSKSSQTNLILPIILKEPESQQNLPSSLSQIKIDNGRDIFERQSIKSNTYVHEATRCIQTEISIDPKKSDPSLSDINIVNDSNCVKLIHEQYKKISQPILEANKNTESNINCAQKSSNSLPENKKTETECTCESVEDRFTSTTNNAKKIDKEVQFNYITNNISDKSDQSPNFSMPIQGTNMTLKVTLGSGVNDVLHGDDRFAGNIKNYATLVSKGTDTVKGIGVENFTSLREECSKEAQCCDTNISETLHRKASSESCPIQRTDIATFNSDNNYDKNNFTSKSCHVKTCMLAGLKYNTYPTENHSLAQKALLRSNTDPSKIDIASNVILNQKTVKELDDETVGTSTHHNEYNEIPKKEKIASSSKISTKSLEITDKSKVVSDLEKQSQSKTSSSESDSDPKLHSTQDPLLDIIQGITNRFSKKNIEKNRRKKCFKEIITVLNYLLDTEESTDPDHNKVSDSLTLNNECEDENIPEKESASDIPTKTLVDKGIQLSTKSKSHKTESSDLPISTDLPNTSSDSATCKVLNKIKKECEKYHQKRCKLHTGGKKCEVSSSTSVNCDQCRRVHHCTCRGHRCRNHKMKTTVEKTKKKSVAYNLIIQTSDSIISEEINCGKNRKQLQNIIVKVPSKRNVEKLPFKEVAEKIERDMPHSSPCDSQVHRSKSLPNENGISSTDEFLKKAQAYTVREFLERNRPDFVEKCSNRQQCLRVINESRTRDRDTNPRLNMIVVHPPTCHGTCMEACNVYCGGVPINNCFACPCNRIQNEVIRIASERAAKRQLLSLQLDRQQALNALSESDLKDLARELGKELRRKKVAPKFINEREMKKHSEKIYKSLPEVVNKKEELKKENLKKTNLLMANIFKKNLQKKTLHGTVNISNYSTVIKI